MQVFGQMARVPVTARQKFEEAAYFYNGMLARRNNVVVFPYYLSAFLSALRSVTYYLQKQYAGNAAFAAWYAQKQQEMQGDPILKMLKDTRDGVVHREPVDLFFWRGFEFPERFHGCIETNHFEVLQNETPDGEATTKIKVGIDGIEEDVPTRISWHLSEHDKEDVASHCYHGLERIDSILKELAAQSGAMELPLIVEEHKFETSA